ncbi:MAG: isocitrate/isopropylmalate dehydrogenase family protein [Deltaproteobacteria bacterium]|jgi:3-isopropylmalate dehydrogenase|nr:isocitrate/isopropylmalate dehydrogenase family protein [Deltaproteobacteria bacterium]
MNYQVAVLPGDGIGPEVINQAQKVLGQVAQNLGFAIQWNHFPYGADYYLAHGQVLPPGALAAIGQNQALLLGAVGDPKVPPGPLEQELLLALRFHFDQYLNLRPARNFPNVPLPCPLKPGEKLDIVVVRENTEDFYMGLGGSFLEPNQKTELKVSRGLYQFAADLSIKIDPATPGAFSLGLLTEPAIRRITQKAVEIVLARGETRLHIATKANALPRFYGFWDRITLDEIKKNPSLKPVLINVDNLCYQLPREPSQFGVILCPNLFGDIVSDLVSALAGGLGLAASANIGPQLSMFEPVHGSAPDIAGTGRANPLAAILSGALLLEGLGQTQGAKLITEAVASYLGLGQNLPFELGGQANTDVVGSLVTAQLAR